MSDPTPEQRAALHELADRLAKITWSDRYIDRMVATTLAGWKEEERDFGPGLFIDKNGARRTWHEVPRYTVSVDACLRLIEHALPGWDVRVVLHYARDGELTADVTIITDRASAGESDDALMIGRGMAPTLPLAMLRAIVAAKLQETRDEHA